MTLADYVTKGFISDCCGAPVYKPDFNPEWIGETAKCLRCYEFCIAKELSQEVQVILDNAGKAEWDIKKDEEGYFIKVDNNRIDLKI